MPREHMDVAPFEFLPDGGDPLGLLGRLSDAIGELLLKLLEAPHLPPERPWADALLPHPAPVRRLSRCGRSGTRRKGRCHRRAA